tara:strand:- start:514 stop:717 length:204 start_codon:yes stop_codon:yes gene_type:complete
MFIIFVIIISVQPISAIIKPVSPFFLINTPQMFYIFFLIYSILKDIKYLSNEIDKKERWQSGLMHWS